MFILQLACTYKNKHKKAIVTEPCTHNNEHIVGLTFLKVW